jgi:hypothetical protein
MDFIQGSRRSFAHAYLFYVCLQLETFQQEMNVQKTKGI